jgi:hypothetical protein
MIVFLNGVENKKHRTVMREVGVKNACLSFPWAKNYDKIDWNYELYFLDRLVVDHGIPLLEYPKNEAELDALKEYGELYCDFLLKYKDIIDFAFEIPQLGCFTQDYCSGVEIVPFFSRDMFNFLLEEPKVAISAQQVETPFFANYYKQMRDKTSMHGYNMSKIPNDLRIDSVNTMSWLLGRYGYTYYYDGKQLGLYKKKKENYRSFVARKMINEGHDLNYNKILKDDIDEVNKMNLISWSLYSNSVSSRRK